MVDTAPIRAGGSGVPSAHSRSSTLSDGSKWLAPIYNFPPVPCPGDTNTVFQTGADPRNPGAGPLVCPSMRMVLDVGNWDKNLFALPGGQSGNPLSPHYDDQFRLWTQGNGITIPWSPEAVERVSVSTLTLSPEDMG